MKQLGIPEVRPYMALRRQQYLSWCGGMRRGYRGAAFEPIALRWDQFHRLRLWRDIHS